MYKRENSIKIISWFVVLVWMGVIFFLSHQPASASSELSSGITAFVMTVIEKLISPSMIDPGTFHFFIRKSAHFFAYFTLGLLVIHALRSHIHGYSGLLLALGICIVYATSDEVHQLFIPGRSGEVMDVLIDSAGAAVGISVYVGILLMSGKQKVV